VARLRGPALTLKLLTLGTLLALLLHLRLRLRPLLIDYASAKVFRPWHSSFSIYLLGFLYPRNVGNFFLSTLISTLDPIMSDNPTLSDSVRSSPIEFIFLGTGTSGSLPNVSCLTAPESHVPCKTCLSTLKPEGKKNIRRNTSAVMRIDGKDGKKRCFFFFIVCHSILIRDSSLRAIVIDVGKNFQAAAVEWFPKYGLRRIDAVLITHAHADGALRPNAEQFFSVLTCGYQL
jgi:hypothetical protein